MESTKYVGLDVHQEAITIAVMNSAGKLILESIIETKTNTILQFFQGLRGDVHVTFEEGRFGEPRRTPAQVLAVQRSSKFSTSLNFFTVLCEGRTYLWGGG